MSIKLTKHQVIPLRKNVRRSKLVCSFKDGFIIPINNASRFFLNWFLDGVLHNLRVIKQMSNMVFYMLCWFWLMSWIAVFWPTRCSISNGFSYIIFATLTFTIYFACWVQVVFQTKQRTQFSCVLTNCSSKLVISKFMEFSNEAFWFSFIFFTISQFQ